MNKLILPALLLLILIGVGWNTIQLQNKDVIVGSVIQSQEYNSVITGSEIATVNGVALKTRQGVLGSVVITGANSSALTFYNATTSDVTLRALATSSLEILANIPGATVAGTYTFDIAADIGLVLDIYPGGTAPTSTITYR